MSTTSIASYEEAVASHEWHVPERYNIAADVCDKHPATKLAMIHEHFDGTVREVRWGELQELSNRFANVLRAHGVVKGDRQGEDELVGQIREHVASRIGKFARPKRIIWADDLPKTRSGKIMRRLLRDIAEGRELGDVTTLRDPDVMQQLEAKIKERQAEGGE